MFQPWIIRGDLERSVPEDKPPVEVDRSHSRAAVREEGSLNSLADCTELSLEIAMT